MALLSAVTEHNYQADPFSKLTPSLCLCRFIPLSVCHSALRAVCSNARLCRPHYPHFTAPVCFCLLTLVRPAESVYLVSFLLMFSFSSKSSLCFCFAHCSLSLSLSLSLPLSPSLSPFFLLLCCKFSPLTAFFLFPLLY